MELDGGFGALYKVDDVSKSARQVGAFLFWSMTDETGETKLYADEVWMGEACDPPFHAVLLSNTVLVLCDGVGRFVSHPSGDPVPVGGGFCTGRFETVVGYVWNRVPPLSVKAWEKAVCEDGHLYEVLHAVGEKKKKECDPLYTAGFSPEAQRIGSTA